MEKKKQNKKNNKGRSHSLESVEMEYTKITF